MPMKVVVIGGTGLIGSKVVGSLRDRGEDVVAAAPSIGVDTITGQGLADALAGGLGSHRRVELAIVGRRRRHKVLPDVDPQPSCRRVVGGRRSPRRVVGRRDRPLAEQRLSPGKLAQARLVEASSVPFSLIQATQFFEFVDSIAYAATANNVVRMPPVLFRPVAADDVAHAVCALALGSPLNGRVELAARMST